jgi:hypothetical protein
MSTNPALALPAIRLNKIVVILQGRQPKTDRSWHCPTESEAEEMVNWLRSNAIRAIAVGEYEWGELPERCE